MKILEINRGRTLFRLAVATLALTILGSSHAAIITDYGTDFTTAANPTPTGWSYLYAETTNGVVTPAVAFPISIGDTLDRPNLTLFTAVEGSYWQYQTGFVGSQPAPWNYLRIRADNFHPGSENTGPVINYTTSAAFTNVILDYEIDNLDPNGDGVQLIAFVNDFVVHVGGVADGGTESATPSLPDLSLGDDVTIWFTNRGSNTSDSTNINYITLNGTAAVPEPSTYALFAIGFLTLLGARRRMTRD